MRRTGCVILLSLFWPVLCLAQQQSLPSTDSPPGPFPTALPAQGSSWASFDLILQQLETALTEQAEESRKLEALLDEAKLLSAQQSIALAESATQIAALSYSLERCEGALKASERLLKEAQALAQRQGLELWVWRGATGMVVIIMLVLLAP